MLASASVRALSWIFDSQASFEASQLNRLVQKSYPDTTTVNYTCDLDSQLTQS